MTRSSVPLLLVGLAVTVPLAGCSGSTAAAAPSTVTSTVTVTVPAPEKTVFAPPIEVTTTPPTVTITKIEAKTVAPAPTDADSVIEDGTWTVGEDGISAGSYKVSAAVDPSAGCYWEINRGGSNGSDIIDNDNVQGGRPSVTLKKGQEFTTEDCGTWVRK